MARLILDGVTKAFAGHRALDRVSIDVANGELIGVLGPSGCGKTTLLRAVAGFEPINEGRITIGDRTVSADDIHVPAEQRRVGIVFQSYALWPHMTVAGNVGYPLRVARVGRAERDRRVAEALSTVGLTGFDGRRPAELSGGQRQRVALARCLVMTPSLVLLDEPLANLDAHLRASMEAEFASFHERTGTTMVYITHDQAEAMALADRIAVMDGGRVQQLATPRELYREPANEMVARFIGEGMVLPAIVGAGSGAGTCDVRIGPLAATLRARPDHPPSTDGRICLRPRDLVLAPETAPALAARVVRSVYRGGFVRIEAELADFPGTTIRVDADAGAAAVRAGEAVRVAVRDGWVIPSPGGRSTS